MIQHIKNLTRRLLLRSQEYTGTDNIALVRNGFWGVLPPIAGSLVSFGLTIIYANFLPKETLGTFKYIIALGGSLSFLTLTGMNSAVMQAVAQGARGALRYSVRLQLRWNTLYIAAATILGGYYIFQHNPTIGFGVLILGIMFPVSAALNTFGAFWAGRGNFRAAALLAVSANLFYGIAIAITIISTKAVLLILIAHTLGILIPAIIAYGITSKHDQFDLPPKEQHALKRFGQHLSLINVFVAISKNIDRIALFHFAGPALLAVYSIANAVPERAKNLLGSALPSILPSLAKKDIKTIRSSLYMRLGQGFLIGILASVFYWILAPTLFHLVAPKYVESIQYSRWLSLSLVLIIPYLYVGNALLSQKMTRGLYIRSWVTNITRIITIPLAILYFGVWGLVVGMITLEAFGLIVCIIVWEIESRRHLNTT